MAMETREEMSSGGKGGRSRLLILFPTPFEGHITPMLQLATILRSKGFSITIVHTLFNSPDPSKHPDFHFEPIPDGLTADELTTGALLHHTLNVKCEKPFRDCLTRMIMSTNSGNEIVSCIISDLLMYFTQSVADELKLPRLALRAGSLTSFAAFAAFPLLLEKGILPIKDTQCEEVIPDLEPLRVKDLPEFHSKDPKGIFQFVSNMVEGTKGSSGFICNTFQDLEEATLSKLRKDLPCQIFPIGPLYLYSSSSSASASCSSLKKQDYTCMAWLEKQAPRSVIYVSFGSVVVMEQEEAEETMWGLLDSKQPFLLVLRRDSVRGSDGPVQLPQGFEEEMIDGGRGLIVEWAPQRQVLAHPAVGGFWTHCGWNSTLESVSEGVPMLCSPFFGDQRVNARCITHVLRIGLQLDQKGLNRAEIAKAVRKLLMVDDEGAETAKELRIRAEALKEKARQSIREFGSSYESVNSLVDHILSFQLVLN
ncbi:hypothetical protein H6P81_006134 [Aristolochia fimbriata]|uniref:Uncharacterized protein n=1 Tax=Aristolochia fimbriata TaxID=158543 RepID=A0AAV7EWG9_ARIFI|nr:hypothetical protein H6P81_006134 [Aristolochia fimbriata]